MLQLQQHKDGHGADDSPGERIHHLLLTHRRQPGGLAASVQLETQSSTSRIVNGTLLGMRWVEAGAQAIAPLRALAIFGEEAAMDPNGPGFSACRSMITILRRTQSNR